MFLKMCYVSKLLKHVLISLIIIYRLKLNDDKIANFPNQSCKFGANENIERRKMSSKLYKIIVWTIMHPLPNKI